MNTIEIKPIKKLDAEVIAPPSKAHILRALLIAALARGKTTINNYLAAEDQNYLIESLRRLGVKIDLSKNKVIVHGTDGKFKVKNPNLFIGNSGVAARLLIVAAGLADKEITIDGDERMRVRPIKELVEGIRYLGIDVNYINNKGFLPVLVKSNSFEGGKTAIKGDKSSQFFTSLLLSAPYAKKKVIIKTEGKLVSRPYIDITISMMKEFGAKIINKNYKEFIVQNNKRYIGRECSIEGDYSNASFFFSAAAITKGKIKIKNLNPKSTQGDKIFVDFLKRMGCFVKKGKDFIEVTGKHLKGIRADMGDYPDIVIPLAIIAGFAKGKTEIFNISHLKYKESDRIKSIATELTKIGVKVKYDNNSIIIEGGKPHGAMIETYKDHRVAMGFAVAGLKVPGIIIKNPEAVNKSYPEFFEELKKLNYN